MSGSNKILALNLGIALGIVSISCFAQESATKQNAQSKTKWGSINEPTETGLIQLTVQDASNSIELPTDLPPISMVRVGTSDWYSPTDLVRPYFSYSEDENASDRIQLHMPGNLPNVGPFQFVLETTEKSQQFADGRIVFSAIDAKVIGETARLESNGNNHRIGFWTDDSDFVQWSYKATRPGSYRLFLTYSLASETGSTGSDIVVIIGDGTNDQTDRSDSNSNSANKLAYQLDATGSWYRYTTVPLGKLKIEEAGEHRFSVVCQSKVGGAVMNLKALTLVPACEGTLPIQSDDGNIVLNAKDATVCGELLRWEPSPKKRTLGYWANESDYAYWDFLVNNSGEFSIEIDQGCGVDQGGSKIEFSVSQWGSDEPLVVAKHTVEDTGHWQNFRRIKIGETNLEPGTYRLKVVASKKAKHAVMDLQQVTLAMKSLDDAQTNRQQTEPYVYVGRQPFKELPIDDSAINSELSTELAALGRYALPSHFAGAKKNEFVADIGCGDGKFSLLLSAVVGDGGKIFARDINQGHLDSLVAKATEHGVGNLHIGLSKKDDVALSIGSIDLALISDVFQYVIHQDATEGFCTSLLEAMKPGGVVIVSYVTSGRLHSDEWKKDYDATLAAFIKHGFTPGMRYEITDTNDKRPIVVMEFQKPGE